jgi:formamidopyrimidine-DNA glycosylase
VSLERLGKRLVFGLEDDYFLVLHLMIAGRMQWRGSGVGIPGRMGLAAFDFKRGTLLITEAGSKKRASLYYVEGREGLSAHDPGGLEVFGANQGEFVAAMTQKTHTLKRALTDPRILSGIGNAYSDEILHRARLSPFRRTDQMSEEEWSGLFSAVRSVLQEWKGRLIEQTGDDFPTKVTAFRPEMAVHGKYRKPCPDCGTPVQRIVYASSESNYCAQCQTGGNILADRVLSKLLKNDWPRTIEELEARPMGKIRN